MDTASNWGIFGHTWAVDMLRQHIIQGNVRHAYLITGPQGIGRRTLALALAQALNCPQPLSPGEPCQTCHTCRRIQEMVFPDLSVVQAEQIGGVLKVDQVRELQHSLALAPFEGRYRVALLLRMEEAHASAANALLKTLEEPNPQVVLVLTASDAESLLPTIVSRCEVLRLRPLPVSLLQQSLQEHQGYTAAESQLLANISNGRPGYAIQLHNTPELLEQRKDCLVDLLRLVSASRVERFAYADTLAKDKETARNTLLVWIGFWHDVLMQTVKSEASIINQDLQNKVESLAVLLDMHQTHRLISQAEQTLTMLNRNVNPRLALEVLLLDLPRLPHSLTDLQ